MENILFLLFPIFFIGILRLANFIASKTSGWSNLVEKFETDDNFTGNDISIAGGSSFVNTTKYANLTIKYNENGLFISHSIFVGFHPPILIPWSEITEVREVKIFLFEYSQLMIGSPPIASIKIKTFIFNKIKNEYKKHNTELV